jgi:ribose 5-phosphate isomerase A
MGGSFPRQEDRAQSQMSQQDQKKAAAAAAAARVEDGMTVGLGTASTSELFVQALAARRLKLTCVATSEATANLARSLDMHVVDLDDIDEIDLTVDGADEIGPKLALIKGAGGALFREKMVWEASRRCIAIADASKPVARLGRAPLPVEVAPFGHARTAARIAAATRGLGITAPPVLRMRGDAPLMTDNRNLIYDLACGVIPDPAALAAALKAITGVVEHGLFLGLAAEALIGTDAGVETLRP